MPDNSLGEQYHQTLSSGTVAEIKELIKKFKYPPGQWPGSRWTDIDIVLRRCDAGWSGGGLTESEALELLDFLIELGANPSDSRGEAVCIAYSAGMNSIVNKVIDHGYPVNFVTLYECRLIDLAIMAADVDLVSKLVRIGADLDRPTPQSLSPLAWARRALEKEADVLNRLQSSSTPNTNRASEAQRLVDRYQKIVAILLAKEKPGDASNRKPKRIRAVNSWDSAFPKRPLSGGSSSFYSFVSDHSEWAMIVAMAKIDDVVTNISRKNSENEIEKKNISLVFPKNGDLISPAIVAIKLKYSPWCVILYDIFNITPFGIDRIKSDSIRLSRRLKTRTLAFSGDAFSDQETLDLFQNGNLAKSFVYDRTDATIEISFTSSQKVDDISNRGDKFIDKFFKSHGIYIPACYPTKRNGKYVLAVDKASAGRIARADIIEVKR